jgi:23S rRNA (uracil1939-C5)-methyltransferase
MTPETATVSCPHSPECPGCSYLERPYGDQLSEKRTRVQATLAAFPELREAAIAPTVPADPIVGYRARSKLVVHENRLGLFAGGTHRVVDIPECRVMDPAIRVVAERVRRSLPLPARVSAVDLRRTDEGVLVTLVVPRGEPRERVIAAARVVSQDASDVAGVAIGRRDEHSAQVLGGAPMSVEGRSRAQCRMGADGPYYFAAPGAFAQAHPAQQRAVAIAIADAVTARRGSVQGAEVLELFAGAGGLSLWLASRGARATTVESYEPSVTLARDAATAQKLAVTAVENDATSAALALVAEGRTFDVVVVNPPRRGLHPDLRAVLPRLTRSLCVYVSCEPVTLARDLADLSRRGLSPTSITPYDMMPLTGEVESLAVLEPSTKPAPTLLFEDERLIVVDKAPHESTTPQGEHDISLLARVRAQDGGADAVPIHRLDIGTSGVCLFARRPEFVEDIAAALTAGQKEYIALAKGITRPKGSVTRPIIEGKTPYEARTRYTRREVVSGHSLIGVRPDQGRKHQIRRHLASIGHAVVGDTRYGDDKTAQYFALRHFLDRPFLHCARITIEYQGRLTEFSADLAPDLGFMLASLRAASAPESDLD